MVTVILNVIEVGFKKDKANQESSDKVRPKTEVRKDGEIDLKFWETLLSSDKKAYECICAEYGVTDFCWMWKKLNEMKREREQEQAEFIKSISNLKHTDLNPDGTASFELDLNLLDSSSRIFIYKGDEMIPFSHDLDIEMKHSLKQVGKIYAFTIRDLVPDDAGLYQLDIEDINVFKVNKPGPPQGPVEVIDSSSSVIEFKWNPPSDTGGSEVTNYLVEGQQIGQSMWKKVWHSSANRLSFRDRNVSHGKKYIQYTQSTLGSRWVSLEKHNQDTNQWVTLNPVNDPIQDEPKPPGPVELEQVVYVHSPPQGYQLYMTCAVRGFPTPHVTWYLNGNCINSNNTYYITNAYGVCSMYIMRVGPK
ncbi:unnamed protein product [Leuciscus chuanchicus]